MVFPPRVTANRVDQHLLVATLRLVVDPFVDHCARACVSDHDRLSTADELNIGELVLPASTDLDADTRTLVTGHAFVDCRRFDRLAESLDDLCDRLTWSYVV